MEKHKCKLCLRNFSNGRALGGHMRSHMVNLPVPPKPEDPPPPPPLVQLSFEADSAPSSSSSSSSSEEEDDDDKALCYGLRENPKRSFRLVDPDFSFPVESSSVILQDRESETESSKNNPTRTRSKRVCNNNNNNQFHHHHHHHHQKKMKPSDDHHKNKTGSSWVEPEPVSSISDATTEEDVAFWLMMLSRDEWKRQEEKYEEEEDDHDEEEEDEDEDEDEEDEEEERSVEDSDEFYEEMKSSKTKSVRGRYKCETCNKVFRSYQALGGHRASHKKIKPVICEPEIDQHQANNNNNNNAPPMAAEKKIHECPVCFRVFASGQALGGHKRTHVTGSSTTTTPVRTPSTRFGSDNNSLIDLNLPAPVDEDEISQIENSAVSDAEFLKPSSQIFRAQVA